MIDPAPGIENTLSARISQIDEQGASNRARRGEAEAFDQEQTNDLQTAGAKRDTNRDLALTARRARQQQSGHVGAGAQEHEAKQREEHRGPDQLSRGVRQFASSQAEHARRAAHVRVVHRVGLFELTPQRRQCLLCLLASRPGVKPGQHVQRVAIVPVVHRRQDKGADRDVEVGVFDHLHRSVAGGEHADDGEGFSVDGQFAADHVRVRDELPSPEGIAEHCHARLALGCCFGLRERAAERHRDPDELEEVAGDSEGPDTLGLGSCPQVQRDAPRAGRRFDDAAVAKVSVVQIRELVAVARLDGVHARGVGQRGLVEEDRLDGAEHRQVDAQTEREREHADNHQTGTPAERTDGVAHSAE